MKTTHFILAIAAVTLQACGGGGSSSSSLRLGGVAATGNAIANGTVSLKCIGGNPGSTRTDRNGKFSMDVTNVTFPCLARVDFIDKKGSPSKLQTIVTSPGTGNITPVSELVVARLINGRGDDAFEQFDVERVKTFTPGQIKAIELEVKLYLDQNLKINTSNLPDDSIGATLQAHTNTDDGDINNVNDGDEFDKTLDELEIKLAASGKKIKDVEDELSQRALKPSSAAASAPVGSSAKP